MLRLKITIAMLSLSHGTLFAQDDQQCVSPLSEAATLSNIRFGEKHELGIIEDDPLNSPSSSGAGSTPSLLAQQLPYLFEPLSLPAKLIDPEKKPDRSQDLSVTTVTLQPFRKTAVVGFFNSKHNAGKASLTNVNPNTNTWFMLVIEGPPKGRRIVYHLENPFPETQVIALDPSFPEGIVVTPASGDRIYCKLWSEENNFGETITKDTQKPFAALCKNRVYLRNSIEGNQTTKEWATDFLRSNIWGGEQVTTFVKETFFRDYFLIAGADTNGEKVPQQASAAIPYENQADLAPKDAFVSPEFAGTLIEPKELGIELSHLPDGKMIVGKWHAVKSGNGIYVSTIEANMLQKEILSSYEKLVSPLDGIELSAMAYMVAFDLTSYEMGFAVGTDHPRVNWSDRALDSVINRSLPGPDGIGTTDPLVRVGAVSPVEAKKLVATFTGGFKRDHGAMKWGHLALVNSGSHYGFIEKGAVLSRLVPGLSTIVGYRDKTVEMRTWSLSDDARLKDVLFARQNGVPILEFDPETGKTTPGSSVSNWSLGNWSGSQNRKVRTLRAGICLATNGSRKFLIYGYFSTITPSGMAKIFQAYQCTYAMHLDMNALEHTYLALYPNQKKLKSGNVQHLIAGMSVLDRVYDDGEAPRFVALPDNRDFFYIMRKSAPGE